MKTKQEIIENWLPRYTGLELEEFAEYILLTNFSNYVDIFADKFGTKVCGEDKPMQSATADNITIINFGMGSAMAATIMDLLAAIEPKAVLFLGKCGGLKKKTVLGDLILPIAAIAHAWAQDSLPDPITPTVVASGFVRYLVAIALVAPVRSVVMCLASMMALSSPLAFRRDGSGIAHRRRGPGSLP